MILFESGAILRRSSKTGKIMFLGTFWSQFGPLWEHFWRLFRTNGASEGAREAKIDVQNQVWKKDRKMEGWCGLRRATVAAVVVAG